MKNSSSILNVVEMTSLLKKQSLSYIGSTEGSEDFHFLITSDTENRSLLKIVDSHGMNISIDAASLNGFARMIFTRLENIKIRQSQNLSWTDDHHKGIYLDEYPEITDLIYQSPFPLYYNTLKRALVKNTEGRGSLFLNLTKQEDSILISTLEFHKDGIIHKNVRALSPNLVLADKTLFSCASAGMNYQYIDRFSGQVDEKQMTLFLSLFSSLFPEIEIHYSNYGFYKAGEIYAERGIQFTNLDEEGNLHLSLLWCLDLLPVEFMTQNRPAMVVRINNREQRLESSPVIYRDSDKIITHLTNNLKKQAKANGQYYSDQLQEDSLFIPAPLALSFLTNNLSRLARDYRLFGTESLKKFKLKTISPKTNITISSGIDFFEGQCQVEIGPDSLTLNQALKLYEENNFIPLTDGTRAIIDQAFFDNLKRILGRVHKGGSYKLSFFDLPLVDSLIDTKVEGEGFTQSRIIYEGFNKINSKRLKINRIKGKLRDYQAYGVKWLSYLRDNRLGGCLADDMGLGKTIQTIALLSDSYERNSKAAPSLVIMPRSLLVNWREELERFAPHLTVQTYYGADRSLEDVWDNNIILTTYSLVRNDIELLQSLRFNFLVLDEIQAIKNMHSHTAKAVMLLEGEYRLGLSGTPMENHVGEIYSVFRFLNPAMFGSYSQFKQDYLNPIQKEHDAHAGELLSRKLGPFILRRLKQEVAKELPDRTEQVIYADMDKKQAALYEERRAFYEKLIQSRVKSEGFGKTGFLILQGMLELRQLASIPEAKTEGQVTSAKWEILLDHLEEVMESGHRCLIFTNFLSTIDILSEKLAKRNVEHLVMTGSTSNRAELVNSFQNSSRYKVFLMTLKTGGVGLNLTAADYVYILDPWWNRSAEQQAIDRTHRIGQNKSVFCYRLIARGTIEEKILELQERKKELISSLISSDGEMMKKLTEDDINYLLSGGVK